MEDIFTSDWFYEDKNIGALIKSPVELMVGIQRMLPMKLESEDSLILLQRVLGQQLFYPPNVAGWPGGRNWIDSSSLMMRMRIPLLINDTDQMNISPKDDDDAMMGRKDGEPAMEMAKKQGSKQNAMGNGGKRQQINADVDWKPYVKYYESVPRENLEASISANLLQVKSQVGTEVIKQHSDQSGRENFIKTATLQIMSTPEYQLC